MKSAAAAFTMLMMAGTLGLSVAAVAGNGASSPEDQRKTVDFATEVRPILARGCLKCHGTEQPKGGLRLNSRTAAIAGGDSGEPAIQPGHPEASELLKRVVSDDPGVRMPFRRDRLSSGEIDLLWRWIAEGRQRGPTGELLSLLPPRGPSGREGRDRRRSRPLVVPPAPAGQSARPVASRPGPQPDRRVLCSPRWNRRACRWRPRPTAARSSAASASTSSACRLRPRRSRRSSRAALR